MASGVVALPRFGRQAESGAGQPASRLGVAGDQLQRRGVYRRVEAAGALEYLTVGGRRPPGQPTSIGRLRGERLVLGDARPQRGDVLPALVRQPVGGEALRGLGRRSRAGQRQHRLVLEPAVLRVLGEAPLGQVDCEQQLAAALGVLDQLQPARRGEA